MEDKNQKDIAFFILVYFFPQFLWMIDKKNK